jgi:hypothetical protein
VDKAKNGYFGFVIPDEARQAALRVPDRIRKLLRIVVYVVNLKGDVEVIKAE